MADASPATLSESFIDARLDWLRKRGEQTNLPYPTRDEVAAFADGFAAAKASRPESINNMFNIVPLLERIETAKRGALTPPDLSALLDEAYDVIAMQDELIERPCTECNLSGRAACPEHGASAFAAGKAAASTPSETPRNAVIDECIAEIENCGVYTSTHPFFARNLRALKNAAPQELPAVTSASRQDDSVSSYPANSRTILGPDANADSEPVRDSAKQPAVAAPGEEGGKIEDVAPRTETPRSDEPMAWAHFASDTHEMVDTSLIEPEETPGQYVEPLYMRSAIARKCDGCGNPMEQRWYCQECFGPDGV